MNYLAPHRSECAALPKGWIREEYPRASGGISSKKSDVYYVSPQGKRVRSKPELLKVLDRYDLTAFDFQTGKINTHLLRNAYAAAAAAQAATGSSGQLSSRGYADRKTVNGRGGHGTSSSASAATPNEARGSHDFARQDASLVPPIRQTASIFKQPVTVHKTSSGKDSSRGGGNDFDEKTNGMKGGNTTSSRSILGLDKPRQIFWEKRLSGLQPSYEEDDEMARRENEDEEEMGEGESGRRQQQQPWPAFKMPSHFKPVGPGVETDILLASISTSIHLGSATIRGQTAAKMNVEDISAFILPDQPLISATSVTQEDVDRQEAKVTATRAKLAKALEALSG